MRNIHLAKAPPPPWANGLRLEPELLALLRMIPPVDAGWPRKQRVRWFRAFAANVSQSYDNPEDVVDLKIMPRSSAP